MTGKAAADHDSVVPVMLDEGNLLRPGNTGDLARRAGVRPLGTLGVPEHHQSEVEAVGLHPD